MSNNLHFYVTFRTPFIITWIKISFSLIYVDWGSTARKIAAKFSHRNWYFACVAGKQFEVHDAPAGDWSAIETRINTENYRDRRRNMRRVLRQRRILSHKNPNKLATELMETWRNLSAINENFTRGFPSQLKVFEYFNFIYCLETLLTSIDVWICRSTFIHFNFACHREIFNLSLTFKREIFTHF